MKPIWRLGSIRGIREMLAIIRTGGGESALFGLCVGQVEDTEVRLEVQRMVACESFLGGGLSAKLNGLDEEAFRPWLEIALEAAEDPDVGTADHLLVVAKKVISEKV